MAGAGGLPGTPPGVAPGIPPGAGVVYPARLSGYLDPNLSRWKWLVKWFLAIPHFIVLFFLWFAFGVVTIVAWFAILFTGHYPRSLFNFNVGVIRWSWRVAFYCYAALGTDRYPPFTLERTDYPADFDVDYPEKLSHGLVLVKSWLLALPHLLIIALLTGTAQTWVYSEGEWSQVGVGMSLFGLLVFIAGVILLFIGVLPGVVRFPDGLEPLDLPRHRLRCADAGRISAVPPGYGPPGPRGSRCDSARRDSCRPRVCAPPRRIRRSGRDAIFRSAALFRPAGPRRDRSGHGRAGRGPGGLLRHWRPRSCWPG